MGGPPALGRAPTGSCLLGGAGRGGRAYPDPGPGLLVETCLGWSAGSVRRGTTMRRVLIGDFGVVARMGLRGLLDEEGLEVLEAAEMRPGITPRPGQIQPDVVLLDLDAEDGPELAVRISSAFPAMKVIACSSD